MALLEDGDARRLPLASPLHLLAEVQQGRVAHHVHVVPERRDVRVVRVRPPVAHQDLPVHLRENLLGVVAHALDLVPEASVQDPLHVLGHRLALRVVTRGAQVDAQPSTHEHVREPEPHRVAERQDILDPRHLDQRLVVQPEVAGERHRGALAPIQVPHEAARRRELEAPPVGHVHRQPSRPLVLDDVNRQVPVLVPGPQALRLRVGNGGRGVLHRWGLASGDSTFAER